MGVWGEMGETAVEIAEAAEIVTDELYDPIADCKGLSASACE